MVVPARQAYSHSASLGKRCSLPVLIANLAQNSTASYQETFSTGKFAPLNFDGLGCNSCLTGGKAAMVLHCNWVIGYFPIKKGGTIT